MNFRNFPKLIFRSSTKIDGNMSLLRGDLEENRKNRINFLNQLDIIPENIAEMAVTHSDTIAIIEKNNQCTGVNNFEDAHMVDGIITSKRGIFLFLLTGDCIPLGLFDYKKQILGLIHCSRKSLDLDIVVRSITILKEQFNCRSENIIAEFGPSIGPCCYKGLTSIEQSNDPKWKDFITLDKTGKYSVDIWRFTKKQLIKSGILSTNITNRKICSFHSGNFFSHRKAVLKSDALDPRFATVFGLR